MPNTYIILPFGQGNAGLENNNHGFWSDSLKRYLVALHAPGIVIGARRASFRDIEPTSLDYWLRDRYVRHPDTMQAVPAVLDALVATGDFEIREIPNTNPGINPRGIFIVEQEPI